MNRHILLVVLAYFLLISVACSSGTKDNTYNEEKMVTLTGEEVLLGERDDVFTNQEFGFGFVIPEPMLNLAKQGLLEIYPISATATVMTFYAEKLFEIMAEFNPSASTEAEQYAIRSEIEKYAFNTAVVLRLPPEAERRGETEFLADIKNNYAVVEEIASIDDTVYYFAYNTDYSGILLSDSEKTQLETVINELKNFEKNVFVFTPIPYEETPMGNTNLDMNPIGMNSFEAKTLDGETVTEAIFKDYDLTMVNIWATWCGPCLDEMPDLAKLHSTMLPAHVNMITLATDGIESADIAREIIASVSGEFMTLIPNADLTPLINTITAIPTTIFVDSNGTIVGERIMGVPGRDPAAAYLDVIEQLLLQLN